MSLTRLIGVGTLVCVPLVFAACADSPRAMTRVDDAKKSVGQAGTELRASDPEESRAAGAGCAIVFDDGPGARFSSLVPRSRLPVELGRDLSAKSDSRGQTFHHIVSGEITGRIRGTIRSVAVACAVASNRSFSDVRLVFEAFANSGRSDLASMTSAAMPITPRRERVQDAVDALMDPLIERAKRQPWRVAQGPSRSPMGAVALASRHLTAKGFRHTSPRTTDRYSARATHVSVSGRLLSSRGSWPFESLLQPVMMMQGGFTLPTVTIIGDSGYWVMNDSEIYWALHGYRWWSGDFNFQGYPDCAAASNLWLAQNDELQNLTADSTDLANAIASVDSYNCELQSNGMNMCLDFFISAKTAGPLNGDNRGYDSSAPYSASRVQVYLDLDNAVGKYYLNSSSTWLPLPASIATTSPYAHGPRALQIAVIDSVTRVVSFEFYNGYCSTVPLTLCPAIDGTIRFTKGANGMWVTGQVLRDNFPTLAIYRQDSQGFHMQFSSPEDRWTDLITAKQTLENWRSKMGLPPGCYLQ